MRFWQAAVTAQLAAGSVWADKFPRGFAHEGAEILSFLVGAFCWWLGKRCFASAQS